MTGDHRRAAQRPHARQRRRGHLAYCGASPQGCGTLKTARSKSKPSRKGAEHIQKQGQLVKDLVFSRVFVASVTCQHAFPLENCRISAAHPLFTILQLAEPLLEVSIHVIRPQKSVDPISRPVLRIGCRAASSASPTPPAPSCSSGSRRSLPATRCHEILH